MMNYAFLPHIARGLASSLAATAVSMALSTGPALRAAAATESPLVPAPLQECVLRCIAWLPCESEPLVDATSACAELVRVCEAECGVPGNGPIQEL